MKIPNDMMLKPVKVMGVLCRCPGYDLPQSVAMCGVHHFTARPQHYRQVNKVGLGVTQYCMNSCHRPPHTKDLGNILLSVINVTQPALTGILSGHMWC